MTNHVSMIVNGHPIILDVHPSAMLVDVLREQLGLIGTKIGCREGECGACTVLLDDELVNACLVPVFKANDCTITTIEGIGTNENPHPLQVAFAQEGAVQCGYCTPGFIMAAYALLKRNPHPSRDAILEILAGNLCRCTGYVRIIQAIESVVFSNTD